MSRLSLKPSDIKKLFALSGNLCAFPGCNEPIIDKSGTVIGEICHIEAAETNGERFNKSSNDEYRRSFENLILFCPKHHKITNDVDFYPAKKLKEFKSTHEKKFSRNEFKVLDKQIDQAIGVYMNQQNKNEGSGTQFNNQANTQNIGTQIGIQNVHNHDLPKSTFNIDGARKVNQEFKLIIDKYKKKASPPDSTVIDYQNEYSEKIPRPIEIIPTKFLRFRKDNGRIISEVESYEKTNGRTLEESLDETQELLREFLIKNDKEKNEELKKLLKHKGQKDPAIITCDGFLINGNRRKMALEELYKENNQNSKFEMMRVVVLPEGATELDIQKIENRYQLQGEGKSEYYGLNRALTYKRNIDRGFYLKPQLMDDSNYNDLSSKELDKKVKEIEKLYLKPLECVDRYLKTFDRIGLYNTISESMSDREGRWQAFIDYSSFYYSTLDNPVERINLGIEEDEIGLIENAIFKIIRKRNLNSPEIERVLGKLHAFVRGGNLKKYLKNPEAKKYLIKIGKEVNEHLPEEKKLDKNENKATEREIDEKWSNDPKVRKGVLENLMKAYKAVNNQIERISPIELIEDSLKKLNHEKMKIDELGIDNYKLGLDLCKKIIARAEEIHKLIDKARSKKRK